ncbi:MAG: helix-turn-helix domain-containing protein [Lachnospiraceae bacterium]
MIFSEQLNQYMNNLSLSNKEIANLSGVSPSVISRYRNGEREPQPDSDILISLSEALAQVAAEHNLEGMEKENILATFRDSLLEKDKVYACFLKNFNILYDELGLNMKDISAFTNFETSFLYRIKSGERKTSDLKGFCEKIAEYIYIYDFRCFILRK